MTTMTTMTKANVKKAIISILIVDDHKMVRDGIRIMLESREDKQLYDIHEAVNGQEALEKVENNDYDVVLLDHQLPDYTGSQVAQRIKELKPGIKILAVSNYDEIAYITDMLKSGAIGYVLKNIGPVELQNAIQVIQQNKNYYSNDVAIKLINFGSTSNINSKSSKKNNISKREIEILKMIASEMTNEQISEQLNIAKRTVDSHRQNLLNKLNVKNTAGLINYAYKNNLI